MPYRFLKKQRQSAEPRSCRPINVCHLAQFCESFPTARLGPIAHQQRSPGFCRTALHVSVGTRFPGARWGEFPESRTIQSGDFPELSATFKSLMKEIFRAFSLSIRRLVPPPPRAVLISRAALRWPTAGTNCCELCCHHAILRNFTQSREG